MKELLIDADVLAYRFAAASEHPFCWADEIYTYSADLGEAKEATFDFIVNVCEQLDTPNFTLFLTGSSNFRRGVWPAYKAKRAMKRKPLLLNSLREWMLYDHNAVLVEGVEADDLLGMSGYRQKDKIICSIDKDLRTVEGYHFNWDKPDDGVVRISAKNAARQFCGQVLTGDQVDNFPGLPGCGPKTAEKILKDCKTLKSMWAAVISAYEKKGLSEADALVQARCAYILKKPSDMRNGNVKLWEPPR